MRGLRALLLKELRHGLNSRFAYVLLVFFAVSLPIPFFWSGSGANVFLSGVADPRPLFQLLPLYFAVFVPLLAMRAWSAERASGTLDLLLAQPVSFSQIVLAKFFANFLFMVLALAASASLPALLAWLGDPDWGVILGGYFGAMLLAASCLAVCLFLGLFARDGVTALILGLCALCTLMALPLPFLNFHLRFGNLARGLFLPADLLFYALVTALFVWLQVCLLRARACSVMGVPALLRVFVGPLLAGLILLPSLHFVNMRIDLTEDRLFSLNAASRDLLADLQGQAHIEVFFSDALPPRLQPLKGFIVGMLDAYQKYGNGKVDVTFLHPDSSEEDRARARDLGISRTRANVFRKNRMDSVELWFGMSVSHNGGSESFPTMVSVDNFEYDLTSSLLRLGQIRKPRVLLVGPTYKEGNGIVFDLREHMSHIEEELSPLFKVDQVRLTSDSVLDLSSVDTLVVWSLSHFTESQLYAVDQFLLRGGSCLLLASGMRVDPNLLLAQPLPASRADALYNHLGFSVNRDLVCDFQCGKIKYTDVHPPVLKAYPLFPMLSPVTGTLDADHSSTAMLKKLVVPWASSLSPHPGSPLRVIARSSDQSWVQQETFVIDPASVPGPSEFGHYALALAFHGNLMSFFEEPPAGAPESRHLVHSIEPANVLVWSSEHLLTQSRDSSVRAWIQHAIGFLDTRGALTGIDRRDNAFRPIRELDNAARSRLQWLSILAMPLLIVAFALVRESLRRRRSLDAFVVVSDG